MNGTNPNTEQSNNLDNTNTNIGGIPNNSANYQNQQLNQIGVNTNNNVQSGTNSVNNQANQQIDQQVSSTQQESNQGKSFIKSEEEIKRIESNYKPPGIIKKFLLFVFFVGLIVFVLFLPEIQVYLDKYISGDSSEAEEIKTGKLVCKIDQSSANLTNIVVRTFNYTNNKLDSAVFETTIKGDPTEDDATLNDLNNKCNLIKENVESLSGIKVNCNYETGKLTKKETFDYKAYNKEEIKAAYTEAGGEIIEYDAGHDINKIMTTMRQGGFTCNKEK